MIQCSRSASAACCSQPNNETGSTVTEIIVKTMKGFFVKHTYRGIGKICEVRQDRILVRFIEDGDTVAFGRDAFEEHELARTTLPLYTSCICREKECTIDRINEKTPVFRTPYVYAITYSVDGLRADVSEEELWVIAIASNGDPVSLLASLNHGGYPLFRVRERLIAATNLQLRQAGGLRALLSSRIDLRPHQAYVAGVVLLDPTRRFLFADEVGLGKTIEAGIVIHDVLMNDPLAKILVLCPGSLTQQWLCELYSKFGGHVFKLLELHASEQITWSKVTKLIASFSQSAYEHAEKLLSIPWDMVVIDEAHHLLLSETLYAFARRLSNNTPSLLLLSAIPAQRREDEFLRILGLLDPQQYTPEVVVERERFRELFGAQRVIGRKLRLLRRRLDGMSNRDFTANETIEQAADLLALPVLRDDTKLAGKIARLKSLPSNSDHFHQEVSGILHYVGDSYRINRRILRNRRERLVDEEQIVPIERKVRLLPYIAEQLEQEVNEAVHRVVVSAKENALPDELLSAFSRILWQSTVHPQAICQVVRALETTRARNVKQSEIDFVAIGYLSGYKEWVAYLNVLCKAVRYSVPDDLIDETMTCAMRWKRDESSFTRYSELRNLLASKMTLPEQHPKILVFAGFPNVAADLAHRLRQDFGAESTTEFRSELERDEKEENVRRFRSDPKAWVMVSDESGGEGRNFQFADGLIHFDTPWYVGRVEQRIGRLDRLGREKEPHTDVLSEVIFDDTSVEGGLIRCYDTGIGVYRRSISGLEFALRDVEARIVQTAIDEGCEGLDQIGEKLTAFAEEERARDDSEALLDEASFDRVAAEKFRRIRHSEQNELALEETFTEYLRMVASNRSVRRISDSEFGDGLWMLRADEIHQIRGKSINGLLDQTTPFKGSFRRAIAQQRLDLNFFNVGHPLFEAICHALFNDTTGRTYAVEIKDLARETWVGFEFVFYPVPDTSQLRDNVGLQNRARQLFTFQPTHIFCRQDGRIEKDGELLLDIRQSLDTSDKGRIWWNLTKEKSLVLPAFFASPGWDQLVYQLLDSATEEAKFCFRGEVKSVVAMASERLGEQARQVRNANGETDEIELLQCLQRSLQNWRVQLDSVGFLSINGGILERAMNGRI